MDDVSLLVLQNHQTRTAIVDIITALRHVMDDDSPLLVQFCCLLPRHWLRTSCKRRKEESNITVCCSGERWETRTVSPCTRMWAFTRSIWKFLLNQLPFSSIKPCLVWLPRTAFIMSREKTMVRTLLPPQNRDRLGQVLNNEKPCVVVLLPFVGLDV